jgi:ribosomal protein L12E/L44/L45/RPP1/RPP2
MALTKAEKKSIVEEALRDYLEWGGVGADTRTLPQLRKEFESRHLQGVVSSYRSAQAGSALEDLSVEDID